MPWFIGQLVGPLTLSSVTEYLNGERKKPPSSHRRCEHSVHRALEVTTHRDSQVSLRTFTTDDESDEEEEDDDSCRWASRNNNGQVMLPLQQDQGIVLSHLERP